MVRLGMPSLTEADTVEQWAALCAELNLQFVELNRNFPQCQLGAMDAQQLKKCAADYGIYFTAHLDDNINVADFNPYVADAYQRTVLETIELAKQANIPVLNMHLFRGAVYTLPERKLYFFDEYREEYLKNMRKKRPDSAIVQYPYITENGVSHYGTLSEEMVHYLKERLSLYLPENKIFVWNGGE